MPVTQLDQTAALVVIDLQKGITAMTMVHPAGDIVARTAGLANAFRARSLPVVLVNVTGMAPGRTDTPRPAFSLPPDWADLAPELNAQLTDIRISKQRVGAFIGTPLDEELRRRGVTQIFLTGIATGSGVEATARSAYDHGYHVCFVSDAMTDRDADVHRDAIEKTFPRLGQVDTTERVLQLLSERR